MHPTELIRHAWADSGKVYGYCKLTDDLRDQGEQISEDRVARLASLAENRLEQQFHASQPDQVWAMDITLSN